MLRVTVDHFLCLRVDYSVLLSQYLSLPLPLHGPCFKSYPDRLRNNIKFYFQIYETNDTDTHENIAHTQT